MPGRSPRIHTAAPPLRIPVGPGAEWRAVGFAVAAVGNQRGRGILRSGGGRCDDRSWCGPSYY